MNVSVSVKLDPGLEKNLVQRSDKIIYAIASDTLRESESVIPMRTGRMRKSSITAGVKGSNRNYYIGSYTSYATRVWNFPDNTNWTTPGTNNRWYERVWKEKGALIQKNVVERNKL
jgi:hypothetical protein